MLAFTAASRAQMPSGLGWCRQISSTMRDSVLILDGACGLEFKKRKAEGRPVDYDLTLFSTAALRSSPREVVALHRDYLDAGANVLTTASYAVTRFYLDKIGEGHRVKELASLSLRLAREAAVEAAVPVHVAASVPPLGESYRVSPLAPETLRAEYEELVGALGVDGGPDIWLLETMPSLVEARAAAAPCFGTGRPVWASFVPRRRSASGSGSGSGSGGDGGGPDKVCLMDGGEISDAISALAEDSRRAGSAEWEGLQGVLFNCATPQLVGAAIEAAAPRCRELGLRTGGYANAFAEMGDMAEWTIEKQESAPGACDHAAGALVTVDLTAREYAAAAWGWVETGASVVGGCCGVGPGHIEALSKSLKS